MFYTVFFLALLSVFLTESLIIINVMRHG